MLNSVEAANSLSSLEWKGDNTSVIAALTFIYKQFSELRLCQNFKRSARALDGPIDNISSAVLIGDRGPNVHPFDGIIDEVRISNTVRSAAWIKASYESGLDHLLDFGSEEVA